MYEVLQYAKAIASLVGAIATALLGVFTADTTAGLVLTVLAVIATAVVTWRVPNLAPTTGPTPQAPKDELYRQRPPAA